MENKRKAALGQAAGASDADDRASKRRKGPDPKNSEYDLMKGESPESTTYYGHKFLNQIRRTSDKTGRLVATYFESCIPREGNEDYYTKTRMPVSLDIIEKKLANQEFSTLSEVESWFKRMVTNAKEFYTKGSQIYDDAERVRKAVSNYMVKTNPAYKLNANYSAVAAPILDNYNEGPAPSAPRKKTPQKEQPVETAGNSEGDEDEDAEAEAEAEEEEAEGEEDANVEADDDDGADSEEDGDGAEESETEVQPGRRRGPGRPPKKPDVEYEGVDYKGLTFQQAQEKIVEEMIRKKEQPGDDFTHFEPFLNLPPRSLKDYYQVIKEPICLKKLGKLVRGIHTRRDKGGKSDFKSWAAFEKKTSLLWENAYYYNEDGSEIALLAKEMEDFFNSELEKAKAVVPEPPQPTKLKLKLGAKEPLPKKITIHVGSPGPATGRSTGSLPDAAANGTEANGINGTPAANGQSFKQDSGRPVSSAAPSPTLPATTSADASSRPATAVPGQAATSGVPTANAAPADQPQPATLEAPPAPPQPSPQSIIAAGISKLHNNKCRHAGRGVADALITGVVVKTHSQIRVEPRFELTMPAHPRLTQQSVTVTIPRSSWTVQIVPTLNPRLVGGRRPYKLYVMVNGRVLARMIQPPLPNGANGGMIQPPQEKMPIIFDAQLNVGVNKISVQIVAAAPKDTTLPDGLDAEFEMFTVLANLLPQ